MASITVTYTFDIPDTLAADIAAENPVADDGTVTPRYYGHGALGVLFSAKRLPAVYPSDTTGHRVTLDRTPTWVRDLQASDAPMPTTPCEFVAGMPAWLQGSGL